MHAHMHAYQGSCGGQRLTTQISEISVTRLNFLFYFFLQSHVQPKASLKLSAGLSLQSYSSLFLWLADFICRPSQTAYINEGNFHVFWVFTVSQSTRPIGSALKGLVTAQTNNKRKEGSLGTETQHSQALITRLGSRITKKKGQEPSCPGFSHRLFWL